MLKIATIDDLSLVLDLSMKFANAIPYKDYIDEEVVKATLTDILTGDKDRKICLLYGEVGFITGVAAPFMFGTDLLATELAWWVEPEYRSKKVGLELLEAFEFWARKIGCKLISMACLDEKVAALYESKGYTLYERAYLKEI